MLIQQTPSLSTPTSVTPDDESRCLWGLLRLRSFHRCKAQRFKGERSSTARLPQPEAQRQDSTAEGGSKKRRLFQQRRRLQGQEAKAEEGARNKEGPRKALSTAEEAQKQKEDFSRRRSQEVGSEPRRVKRKEEALSTAKEVLRNKETLKRGDARDDEAQVRRIPKGGSFNSEGESCKAKGGTKRRRCKR
jgi:hypothetical protein